MELLKNLEGLSADEQMTAVVELQKAAMKTLEEQKQASIGKSAELVIQGLKKIKSDFEAKFDSLNYDIQTKVASLKDGEQGLQGPKGDQGERGLDGANGRDGRDGKDGKDGLDGVDGVGVRDAKIDFDGSLVISLTDGREINCGEVVSVDVAKQIQKVTHNIQTGSGGDSQTVLDAIAAIQATIATYGTMATQNANNVAITGGAINNTTIGATTPNTGVFTTLTAQNETLKGTGQNFLLQSQAFTTASWIKQTNVTATDNTTVAPDGTTTAATISWGSASNGTGIYGQRTGLSWTGLTNTKSIYVRADVAGGTVTMQDPGLTLGTATLTLSTAWQRITLTESAQLTIAGIWLQKTASSPSTIYIWGGQLEIGSVANTYIPTTTTAVYGTPTLSFSGVASLGLQSDGSLYETSAGTGNVRFYTNNIGQEQARVSHTASAVNFVQVTGAATGGRVAISAQGSDTNIPLVLQPKGTGALQAQQTDSTATGGNARGANAVDWQTIRSGASQVAAGQYGVVSGGISNTVNSVGGVIGGGSGNFVSSSGYVGGIFSGLSNQSNGFYSPVVGGASNQANGYYNFVGGGFTNTGTASAAVTTQSGTMNGTTAVTLSGSNASIKVGQIITGTSIANDTYVAAISGTSLTLSKAATGSSTSTLSFFTPHGVVVGGGNNQATGSYSFIGGGGDAGTAANRNVASGGWSTISGGFKNTASGIGAVVAGGGTYDGANGSGNTASGLASFVSGGWSNNASAVGAVCIGVGNQATADYSTASGQYANTRGIIGNFAISPCNAPLSAIYTNQIAFLVLARQTTDATATVLTSNTSAAGTTNQVILPNNSAYYFKGTVIANVTGGGNTKGWTIEGAIKRGANAASTALVGTPTVTSSYADAGASTWAITATADTTNGGLAITFTGQASTTIRCVCKLETTEVTF